MKAPKTPAKKVTKLRHLGHIRFFPNDGGREAAGHKGLTGDCACRALAIVTGMPYQKAYDLINEFAAKERKSKRRKGKSNARTGVHTHTFHKVMEHLGFEWTPTMQIGQGCTTHLRTDELPAGRLILNLSRHFAAFIDGTLHDNHDCSRGGTRCVYGYWHKPAPKKVDPKREALLEKVNAIDPEALDNEQLSMIVRIANDMNLKNEN